MCILYISLDCINPFFHQWKPVSSLQTLMKKKRRLNRSLIIIQKSKEMDFFFFLTNYYFLLSPQMLEKKTYFYQQRVTALHIVFTNLLSISHFSTILPLLSSSLLCIYFLFGVYYFGHSPWLILNVYSCSKYTNSV